MEIGIEDRGIEPVALETASQVKSAAAPQDGADERNIEVDAGGHVRDRQAFLVDDVTQEQVIDVAAMAGDVDDFLVLGDIVQPADIVEFDAVVDPVPEPAQETHRDTNRRVRYVRRDLHQVVVRLALGRLEFAGSSVAGLGLDGALHTRRAQYVIDENAPVRQIGADRGDAPLPKMHSQDARHLAIRDAAVLTRHAGCSQ